MIVLSDPSYIWFFFLGTIFLCIAFPSLLDRLTQSCPSFHPYENCEFCASDLYRAKWFLAISLVLFLVGGLLCKGWLVL